MQDFHHYRPVPPPVPPTLPDLPMKQPTKKSTPPKGTSSQSARKPTKESPGKRSKRSLSAQAKVQPRDNQGQFAPTSQGRPVPPVNYRPPTALKKRKKKKEKGFFGRVGDVLSGKWAQKVRRQGRKNMENGLW